MATGNLPVAEDAEQIPSFRAVCFRSRRGPSPRVVLYEVEGIAPVVIGAVAGRAAVRGGARRALGTLYGSQPVAREDPGPTAAILRRVGLRSGFFGVLHCGLVLPGDIRPEHQAVVRLTEHVLAALRFAGSSVRFPPLERLPI